MSDMEHPDIFKAGEEGRIEEQKYVQSRGPKELQEQKSSQEREHLRAYQTMREYTAVLGAMPEYIRDASKRLDESRASGDRAGYDQLLQELNDKYQQFTELSQRMVALAEDKGKAGDAAREMARMLMQEDRREELEDAYRAAMASAEKYGRRRTDFTPETRPTPPELVQAYEAEATKIVKVLVALQSNIDLLEKARQLDDAARAEFRQMLSDAYSKFDDLDRSAGEDVQEASSERKVLLELFNELKNRVARPAAVAASSPLAGLRATHQQVKAQYAAVQHTLTQQQRMEMRMRIAQMTALVQQAEDEAWHSTFAASPTPPPPPPPEPPAPADPHADIRESVQLAIARATEAAIAISLAFETPVPTPEQTGRRGIFSALGDAFRLR